MKEPVWIDEREALVLHDRLLALHGGAAGVRNHPFVDGNSAQVSWWEFFFSN